MRDALTMNFNAWIKTLLINFSPQKDQTLYLQRSQALLIPLIKYAIAMLFLYIR